MTNGMRPSHHPLTIDGHRHFLTREGVATSNSNGTIVFSTSLRKMQRRDAKGAKNDNGKAQ